MAMRWEVAKPLLTGPDHNRWTFSTWENEPLYALIRNVFQLLDDGKVSYYLELFKILLKGLASG